MNRNNLRVAGLIFAIFAGAGSASAGTKLLNVQGKLTNSGGTALNGNFTVTFRLYASLTGSTTAALWTESQSVTVSTGNFNVTLGNVTALDSMAFSQPYYLGMQVSGDSNELSPRQLLGASAYALGSLGDFNVKGNLVSSGSITAAGAVSAQSVTVSSNVTVGGNVSAGGITAGAATVGSLAFNPTTNGIVGTAISDNAASGIVGEYVQSAVSGVPIGASCAYKPITSISLTPGDWDVSGALVVGPFASPSGPNTLQITTDSTGSSSAPGDNMNYFITSNTFSTGNAVPRMRFALTSTTTVYLVSEFCYSSGSPTMWGSIKARRVR